MIRWGLLGVAALLLALAQIGLHVALGDVSHEPLRLESGTPATLYLPDAQLRRPGVPLPVVVLAHGWGTNRAALRALARDLVGAGYAALAIDLPGHGGSPRPFAAGVRAARALADEVDAAVLYARLEQGLDGQRIALLGHGIGADAVLDYASRAPAVAGVVALAPEQGWSGAYTPPNALLLWGEQQSSGARRRGRELGVRLIGQQQIRLGRPYGEFERGTAVFAREVEGMGYLGLPLADDVRQEVQRWLLTAFAVNPSEPRSDPPSPPGARESRVPALWPWCALGLLGSGLLFAVLVSWLPVVRTPRPEPGDAAFPKAGPPASDPAFLRAGSPASDPLALRVPADRRAAVSAEPVPLPRSLLQFGAALAVGVLLAGGADAGDAGGPFAFFPFAGARHLLGVLAAAGALLGALALARGEWRRPAGATLLGTLGLALVLYLTAGTWLEGVIDPWIGPRRIAWTALCAALLLPFFACTEHELRRAGIAGWLLPGLAKLLLFAALLGATLLDWLPRDWLTLGPAFAAVLLALEAIALRLHAHARDPWPGALLQALVLAWFLTATFPLEV